MLAARLPGRPGHGEAARRTCSSAASTGCRRATRVLLDLCLRFRPLILPDLRRHRRRDRLYSSTTIPKGFFPQEDIGQLSVSTEARQDISFPAMVELQGKVEDVLRARPTWRMSSRASAAAVLLEHAEQRPLLRRAEAARRAPALAARSWPTCAANSRGSRASTLHHAGAESALRRPPVARANTSSSCRASNATSSTTGQTGSPTPWAREPAIFTDVTERPAEHRASGNG